MQAPKYILAIDPGPEKSGWCVWDRTNGRVMPGEFGMDNVDSIVDKTEAFAMPTGEVICAIEMVASYGMPVGKEVFNTCVEIGRATALLQEVHSIPSYYVYRKEVIRHFNHSNKGNDATLRQALVDRFGGKGTKEEPGPFYGISGDVWSAVAIAVYFSDKLKEQEENVR